MDLHHLRHFIAVAEELHFGRAATRLGIAQPALSQSIGRLEKSMGVKLLDRSRRMVALTEAGKVLLEEGHSLITHAETTVRLTQRAANRQIDKLQVGFTPWALTRVLPLAMRQLQQKWPMVVVQLDERNSRSQVAGLRDGSLDLAVINVHAVDTKGLSTRCIEKSPIVAAVPTAWPIASKKTLRMVDLAKLPFILFPRSWSPNFHTLVMTACRKAGFVPNVTQNAKQTQVMLNLIANELGVTLLNETVRNAPHEGVTLIPVTDFPDDQVMENALAWNPKAMNPVLEDFIDLLQVAAQSPAVTRRD